MDRGMNGLLQLGRGEEGKSQWGDLWNQCGTLDADLRIVVIVVDR
jgi:hypothetical protein